MLTEQQLNRYQVIWADPELAGPSPDCTEIFLGLLGMARGADFELSFRRTFEQILDLPEDDELGTQFRIERMDYEPGPEDRA